MEKSNRGIMFAAAPAAMAALLLGLVAPGTALLGTPATTDSVSPHGYVTVSVTRDGQEIYRHEEHNLITTAGRDFIRQQIGALSGGTPAPEANGANFIGLSTDTKAPHASDTCLSTTDGGSTSAEITTGGLARAQGSYAEVSTDKFTITRTFTASAGHTNVQKAGLFTAAANGDTCAGGNDGTMMAENTFTAVTLANNDQLTITWTVTLS